MSGLYVRQCRKWSGTEEERRSMIGIPLYVEHDNTKPCGRIVDAKCADGFIFVEIELDDTPTGRETHDLIQKKQLDGVSFGRRHSLSTQVNHISTYSMLISNAHFVRVYD